LIRDQEAATETEKNVTKKKFQFEKRRADTIQSAYNKLKEEFSKKNNFLLQEVIFAEVPSFFNKILNKEAKIKKLTKKISDYQRIEKNSKEMGSEK